MLTRAFVVAVAFAVLGTMVLATPDKPAAKIGDRVHIKLTGGLARHFAERACPAEAGNLREELGVQCVGVIKETFSDGRLCIEHSLPITREGKLARMVTLTAVVDANQVTRSISPANTAQSVPLAEADSAAQPTLTTEASEMLTLQLSDLKGLKLRTWTLAEELGE